MAGVKRNQQLEREKQAQLMNEVKQQEGQNDEKLEEFKVRVPKWVRVSTGRRVIYCMH